MLPARMAGTGGPIQGKATVRLTLRRAAWTHGVGAFLVAVGIDALGNGLFLPVSLLYFTRVSEVPLATVGMLLSLATAATLPLPLFIGRLVDTLGARRVVVAAQVLQAAGFLGYLFATGPATILLAALVVAGGQRAFWSSFFALATEFSGAGRERQDRWFAYVGMAQGGAFGAGGLAAGLLLGTGAPLVYRLLVVANVASFVFAAVLLLVAAGAGRPGHEARDRRGGTSASGYRLLLADRPYLALIAVNTSFALCSTLLAVALPVYIVDGLTAPHWLTGPLLGMNTVLLAIGQALVMRVVRVIPRARALAVAGASWTVWCRGLAAAVRVPSHLLTLYLIVVTLFFTWAELIHAPLSNSLATSAAPEPVRGRYLAAFQLSFAVANVLTPGLFALLFTRNRALPWLVVAALAALGTAGMAALERALPASRDA